MLSSFRWYYIQFNEVKILWGPDVRAGGREVGPGQLKHPKPFQQIFCFVRSFFDRLPKFKYIDEIIYLISLKINLKDNTCKNANNVVIIFPIIISHYPLFFHFFETYNIRTHNITSYKTIASKKKSILIQKCPSFTFRDAG